MNGRNIPYVFCPFARPPLTGSVDHCQDNARNTHPARHISHLWAAYPDDDITFCKTPELAETVRVQGVYHVIIQFKVGVARQCRIVVYRKPGPVFIFGYTSETPCPDLCETMIFPDLISVGREISS
ncbi:MAG: hypothetical protein LBM08_05490 [Dysgonamonadaceae bacterium]|nr:hypothetical protein [Dysgonamonadaceae bacterium]